MARLHFPCYIVKVIWRKKRLQFKPTVHSEVFQDLETAYKVYKFDCHSLSDCYIQIIIDYGNRREVYLAFDKRHG